MKSLQNISYKTLFTILFFSLAGIIFFLRIGKPANKVSAAWWDEMWHYRKAISIENSSGSDLTDFQVSISIGTSQLVAEGKMQSDCDDIRITDINGNLLPHWIEENNPGCNQLTDTKIWLKANSLPTSGATIYIYYGNQQANNSEDGDGVFEFFDDFSNNLNKWINTSNSNWSISNEILNITPPSNNNYLVANKSIGTSGFIIEARVKSNSTSGLSHPGLMWHANTLTLSNHRNDQLYVRAHSYNTTSNVQPGYYNGGLITFSNVIGLFNYNTWYNLKIEIDTSNSIKYYRDDINEANFSNQQYQNTYTGVVTHSGGNMQFDNFRVRKYASTDPTPTLQSEETSTAPIAYWKFDNNEYGGNYTQLTYATIKNDITNGYLNSINTGVPYNNATKLEFTVKSTDNTSRVVLVSGFVAADNRGYPCILGGDITASSFTTATLTPSGITRAQFSDGTTRTFTLNYTSSSNSPISFGSWTDSTWSRTIDWYSFKIWNNNTLIRNFVPIKRNSDNVVGFYDTVNSVFYINVGTGSFTAGNEIASDSTSNQNNGTISGATWVSEDQCISGKCLSFDGNDFVNTNFGINRNISTNPTSISMWVKPTSAGSYMFLSPNQGTNQRFYFATYGGKWDMGIQSSGWGGAGGNINVDLNKWAHIEIVANGSTVYMYVNGKITSQKNYTSFTFPENLYIGIHGSSGSYGFYGLIDEVKVYPYARTADQIKQDYNSRGSLSGSSVNLGIKSNTVPNIKSNLVAHYRFDENNGTTAYDSSGNNIIGTFSGSTIPTWSSGKYGAGVNFNGINTYIDIGNSSPIRDFTDQITVSVWAKYNAYGGGGQSYSVLAVKGTPWTFLMENPGNKIRFRVTVGGIDKNAADPQTHNLNQWYHFVGTYDGQNIKIYKNGILAGTTPATGNLGVNNVSAKIGTFTGTTYNFDGLIDEVKIYNRALTAEEVKQDYNQGSVVQFGSTNQTIGGTTTSLEYCIPGDTSACSAPIAEWNFEENTGTIAKDTSGNNNDGTFGTGDSSPTWDLGVNNKGAGVKFDGINDIINSTNNIKPTDFTASMWIYPTSWGHQPIATALLTERSSTSNGFFIFIENGGNLNFDWGGSANRWDTGYVPPLNTWTYLTISRNSNGRYLYVNGKLQNSTATVGVPITANSVINIGWASYSGPYNFKGKMDNIKIYDYARTPAQIAYDYNRGAPIGWWKLDECQGSIAFDSSGLGNTGTIIIGASGSQNSLGTCAVGTSAAWTNGASGKINSSLNFDGTDDYISIPDSPSLTPNEITIAAWVKNNNSGDSFQRIVDKIYNQEYAFFLGPTGTIGVSLVTNTSSIDAWNLLPNAVTDSNWHHVAFNWSATTKKITVYVDGVAKTNTTLNGDRIADSNNPITIGDRVGLDRSFNGQIDDVRIYNYALTSEQIKQVYNGGSVNFR